jgi:hypothetical protein
MAKDSEALRLLLCWGLDNCTSDGLYIKYLFTILHGCLYLPFSDLAAAEAIAYQCIPCKRLRKVVIRKQPMGEVDYQHLGSREEITPQDCAGFGFDYKAHPAAHIEIRVGGCSAAGGPEDKQDVELFFAGAHRPENNPREMIAWQKVITASVMIRTN